MPLPVALPSRRFLRRCLAALGLAGAVFLAGCPGGGGGGSSAPAAGSHTGSGGASIQHLIPPSGPPGTRIEIQGVGLNMPHSVTLGGKPATFVSWNDTKLVIWVPYDASDGTISVTTMAGGVITSPAPFKINADAPRLWSFSPTSAPPHANLTLYGDRLKDANKVTIGAMEAAIKETSTASSR
jgi:hypothetical protein